jgi:hypothetical protein
MAGTLTPTPYQTVLDGDGVAVSGAKITTTDTGTGVNSTTYTSADLSVANTNPIVADSAGRYVAYLPVGANFTFAITTSADVAIEEQTNIQAVPGSSVNLDVEGTVGEAVTAGQVLYLSSAAEATPLTAGRWYLTDADAAPTSTTPQSVGVAVSAIAINAAGTIRLAGEVNSAGSVLVGTTYYVGATPGAIVSSAPALSRQVGVGLTTSSLLLAATTAVVGALPNPITQDLLFTDNTYDIGKSGATRPRDLFASRNAVIGGTLTLSGGLNTPLVVAQGGTGVAALTANSLLLGAGTGNVTFAAPGTSGNILTSNGTVWASATPATATSLDTGTVAYAGRTITVDTGGALNVVLAASAGDDFTVDTDKLVVSGDSGAVGIGDIAPNDPLHITTGDAGAVTMIRLQHDNNSTNDAVSIDANMTSDITTSGQINFKRVGTNAATDILFSTTHTSGSLTERMSIDSGGTVDVVGTFTAGTKTFRIPHPLPELNDTNYLIHGCLEGPRLDLIYRGTVTLVDGAATVDLDEAAGMTAGTWALLCRDEQVFSSNETGWFHVRGSVSGSSLTITCEEGTCTDTVSWMVVAERQDDEIKAQSSTDEDGHLMIEPLHV